MSRFDDLTAALAAKGASDPAGLAAVIGRRKYGRAGMKALAAAGRKKKAAMDNRSELLRADRVDVVRSRSLYIEDFAFRSDGSGRTVDAYCAAFNKRAEVRDQDGHYYEELAPGSFDKTIAERGGDLLVLYNHGRTLQGTPDGTLSVPIGVPVESPRADTHGVLTATRYLDNPLADWVLDAIKQRAIKGQSFTGRFIKSQRTRASQSGGLPTIVRNEVAMSEYGPTPIPYYTDAKVLGTRSAQAWMADLVAMDPAERADLFAQMVALATPLSTPPAQEPVREHITVTATPPEPAPASATATRAAGTAEEPHTHSARQHDDIKRRIRTALITRTELTTHAS